MSIRVSLVSSENLIQTAKQLYGICPNGQIDIAEALTCELFSRQTMSKRALIDRVLVSLNMFAQVTVDEIKNVFDFLEDNGDVLVGANGMVARTPLRAILINHNKYLLFGTIPSQVLQKSLPADIKLGTRRVAYFPEDKKENVEQAIAQLAGRIISIEVWSGIDRVEAADNDWLELLEIQTKSGNLLELQDLENIQAYIPKDLSQPQKTRWQKNFVKEDFNLLRQWQEHGYWRYFWAKITDKNSLSGFSLSSDEARRTMFATDRKKKMPINFEYELKDKHIELEQIAFLPRAEYRYLIAMADIVSTDKPLRYLFDIQHWQQVVGVITNRLGVSFKPKTLQR